ncbi:MAG: Gldg family protein [Planctomycetota bacterium]
MNSMNRSVLGTALILIITFCSIFLVAKEGRKFLPKIDATESGAYTLSEGSERIVEKLRRPLTLKLFFSEFAIDKTGQRGVRELKSFYASVRDLLYAYVDASGGKLTLEEYDPRAFSPEEEAAERLGITRLTEIDTEGVYFGLGIESSTGAKQSIAFLNPAEQAQLEYKITEAIELATSPPKTKVGILSTLPVLGAPGNPQFGQPGQPAWGSIQQLQRLYEVVEVPAEADEILDVSDDSKLDYLIVIHPKDLSEGTLYAIDQFVMGGGKLMVFCDPHASIADPNPNQQQRFAPPAPYDSGSDLNRLLEAWGARLAKPSQTTETEHKYVAGDTLESLAKLFYGSDAKAFAKLISDANPGIDWATMQSGRTLKIPATLTMAGDMASAGPIQQGRGPLPTLLRLAADAEKVGLVEGEPAVEGLARGLVFLNAGVLQRTSSESGDLGFAPLVTTSEEGVAFLAGLASIERLEDARLFEQLQATREAGASAVSAQPLAVRISGTFRTAFPGGKPDSEDDDQDGDGVDENALTDVGDDEPVGPVFDASHVPQCAQPNQVIVFADVDMLTNSLAVAVQQTQIGMLTRQISSNHELMINCLDVLANSTDLMSVRSRGNFTRTFELIEELEREAAEKTSEETAAVQEEIDQFLAEKTQMQQQMNQDTQRALQAEFRTKSREINQKILDGRRRLNELKRGEREAIEAEENQLRFVNVVVIPAVFLLLGLGVAIVRWNRRQSAKGAVS